MDHFIIHENGLRSHDGAGVAPAEAYPSYGDAARKYELEIL